MTPRAYMSFGAGVQSTAIAMLAINRDERLLRVTGGVLPELYLFADTHDEPRALYAHVEAMRMRIEASGAAFRTVQTPLGGLAEHVIHALRRGHARIENPPFFVSKDNNHGPIQRHCTNHFKIAPLSKRARDWFGVHRGKPAKPGPVQMWLGISADEPQRLKAGPVPKQEWSTYFNPLYEMRWHRADCLRYLSAQGIAAQRSACVFCPFHSRAEWRAIRAVPDDWAKAIAVDEALEAAHAAGGAFGFHNPLYLNRDGVRLRDMDLSAPPDQQAELWDNECAGVCNG